MTGSGTPLQGLAATRRRAPGSLRARTVSPVGTLDLTVGRHHQVVDAMRRRRHDPAREALGRALDRNVAREITERPLVDLDARNPNV